MFPVAFGLLSTTVTSVNTIIHIKATWQIKDKFYSVRISGPVQRVVGLDTNKSLCPDRMIPNV